MVKTTFNERFDKAVKFYDHTYHMHKATFKGLSSFYKSYAQAEKDYADALINLTKSIWDQIPQLKTENAALLTTIRDVINSIQTTSQLHFNYGERLVEVSAFYQSEYLSSRKKKENHMKMIRDRNISEYQALRQRQKNRNIINDKQKEICKVVYDNLDKLASEENDRIQKIKQQTIIYFSLYKKICEKQLERGNQYNIKLCKQDFQIKNHDIEQIAEEVRIQYNEYGGDQIERKSYDVNQSMVFHRESLRQSLAFKQRMTKVNDYQNRLKSTVDDYQNGGNDLQLMNDADSMHGMLDGGYFQKQQRRKIAREYSGPIVRAIAYDLLDGYTQYRTKDSEDLMLLQLIKANLKVNSSNKNSKGYSTIGQFWNQTKGKDDQQYRWHVALIQQLWKVYENDSPHINIDPILHHIKLKNVKDSQTQIDNLRNAPFQIGAAFIDILLDAICSARAGQSVLVEGYVDFLVLVAKFGENILNIQRNFTVLILLRKVQRLIGNKQTNQEVQQILQEGYFSQLPLRSKEVHQNQQRERYQDVWIFALINNCTKKILYFYQQKPALVNYIKILLLIEKLGLAVREKFNARERVYSTLRLAGFNFLKSSKANLKMLNSENWSGEERLQSMVQVTEDLDYEGIMNAHINPAAVQVATLLGVGDRIAQSKMFDQFTEPFYRIMDANLRMMAEQEGSDVNGYVLRLGIILARLDLMNPLPVTEYDSFFKVLKLYLESTEKQYDKMLEHSRQTELWIMEQNSHATANCIDFCSLLYKPFEFLLISLKKLQESQQTDYTKKYAEFIKLRLNTVLRDQIIKYVQFLYESLTLFQSDPPQLVLKPRRIQKLHRIQKDQTEKDRYNFKELTRRLFNLLFLKEQLEEMICDFLDPQLYRKLDNSIFNLDKLKKYASQSPQYRELLGNIRDIVEAVLASEDRIVKKVAGITVFHFFKKIFDNLYFQEEKNALQGFFSSDSDYKLSNYTLVYYQEIVEEWFALIAKNIPEQFLTLFSEQFSKCLFQAIQFQALNSTKFKIPIPTTKTVPYLDSDVAFIVTMMKQKFFQEQVVNQEIRTPFQKLLSDLKSDTAKLCGMFESATLKNDKQRCKYVLVVLNLRIKDQKAMQFIKKYKTIVK